MSKLLIHALLAMGIFLAVSAAAQAAPTGSGSALIFGEDHDYNEECNNEGCYNEEVEEMHETYYEECFGEGCSYEEQREIAGHGRENVDEMLDAFRRLGLRVQEQDKGIGPFNGSFSGTITGHGGSKASISVALKHRDGNVTGTVTLGKGLRVDVGGGVCGGVHNVPQKTLNIAGATEGGPRNLKATSNINVDGRNIKISISANLLQNGRDMKARMTLDAPWPCDDPTLSAELTKE